MTPYLKTLPLLLMLAACGDGQPFFNDEDEADLEDGEVADGVVPVEEIEARDGINFETSGGLPPGTADPTADGSIIRFEPRDGEGAGLITDVEYVATNDTFRVDNIGFDGANVYQRGVDVDQLGGYAVYEADVVIEDSLTADPISQITPYRVIYGASKVEVDGQPRTSFALVRTGGYSDHGFGGWIYQRREGVTLPTTGQAGFNGTYAGMRTFTNQSGMQLTEGDIAIAIDFRDFNSNAAVSGTLNNRQFFTITGDQITLNGPGQPIAPPVQFVIQEGGTSITTNGEIVGQLNNTVVIDGTAQLYEQGTYNGVIAGDLTDGSEDSVGSEITGIIVMESTDPNLDGVTVRESGGFIASRKPN